MNKRKREEKEDGDDDDEFSSLAFATLPIVDNKEFKKWKKQKLPEWLNNK